MTDQTSDLSERIKQARVNAGLTQAQVAERLGLSRGAVTLWESDNPDTRSSPSIATLREFAEVVGVSFLWILGETDQENATTEVASEPSKRISSRQAFHFDGCWSLGPSHYKCACKEIANLRGWGK